MNKLVLLKSRAIHDLAVETLKILNQVQTFEK